jgi:ABC-type tungstate transport system substrate-binding protein
MNDIRIALGIGAAAIVSAAIPGLVMAVDMKFPVQGFTLISFVDWMELTLIVGVQIALLHAVLVGLPAYLLLSRRGRVRWWHAGLGGALIGGVPLGLFFISGGVESALVLGLAGLVGGLVFWAVAHEREEAAL